MGKRYREWTRRAFPSWWRKTRDVWDHESGMACVAREPGGSHPWALWLTPHAQAPDSWHRTRGEAMAAAEEALKDG